MFPSFEIFGRQIGMYGIMAVIGFAACVLVGSRLIRRYEISMDAFALAMIFTSVCGCVCAFLLYGMTNIKTIIYAFAHFHELGWGDFLGKFAVSFAGFVYYGGFIGSAVGLVIYTGHADSALGHRDHLLDIYAVLMPLFHFFGRIGCFFAGCCYGIESDFGYTVHGNRFVPSVNDVNRFPVQLIESGCNLIIFLVLLYLFRKRIMEARLIYIYMLIYPVVRFIDEFFRGDVYRGIFWGLSTSQWISIGLFIFALIMLPVKTKKLKKEQEYLTDTK